MKTLPADLDGKRPDIAGLSPANGCQSPPPDTTPRRRDQRKFWLVGCSFFLPRSVLAAD
jgi:hypothetical protein